jgi:hypothetical protein
VVYWGPGVVYWGPGVVYWGPGVVYRGPRKPKPSTVSSECVLLDTNRCRRGRT